VALQRHWKNSIRGGGSSMPPVQLVEDFVAGALTTLGDVVLLTGRALPPRSVGCCPLCDWPSGNHSRFWPQIKGFDRNSAF